MKLMRMVKNWKRNVVVFSDIVIIVLTFYLAFWIRFLDEGFLFPKYFPVFKQTLPLAVVVYFMSFVLFGLYKALWRYASINDLIRIFKAIMAGALLTVVGMIFVLGLRAFPRSVFIIHPLLLFFVVGASRLGIRVYKRILPALVSGVSDYKRVILVGAGDAGEMILRESQRPSQGGYKVVGFVDDNVEKINRDIHGVKILGPVDALPKIANEKYVDEIIIAISSATREEMRRIIDVCSKTNLPYKTIPSLSDVVDGKVSFSEIRKVEARDLLSREVVKLDLEQISRYVSGKRVLITGAGGSIGSELCRQLTRFNPQLLILFGRGEFSLYNIQKELEDKYSSTTVVPVIGNIRDERRTRSVLGYYEPHVIFHTAAHKHVPLMEADPCEAVKNNVTGSRIFMEAAEDYGVKQFVLISTDKAVNPTSYMGASKRVAELLLQAIAGKSKCRFCAVRFGNVLESRGSVLPLFKEQIKRGGPVTVTHPQISRYFMTTSEAAQLVIQAGAMGHRGEIFVLDMGSPIKIIDLARDLIRLSGFEADEDIKIEITGLRPGEKLYEDLVAKNERTEATWHQKILLIKPNQMNVRGLREKIGELERLAIEEDVQGVKKKIEKIVPEFSHQA
jgi:FlaA1/EpsC-like NDP-sugar epimerase